MGIPLRSVKAWIQIHPHIFWMLIWVQTADDNSWQRVNSFTETWKPLSKSLKSNGHCLVPVTQNLVDLVWDDQPAPPNNSLIILQDTYTGNGALHGVVDKLLTL